MYPITLIITVGTRDVKVDRDDAFKIFSKEIRDYFDKRDLLIPRTGGEWLLSKLNNYSSDSSIGQKIRSAISLPLIKPAIEYIRQERLIHDIHRIVLIVTDQGQDVQERFRVNDSIVFAKIIEQVIRDEYLQLSNTTFEVEAITDNVTSVTDNNERFRKYIHTLSATGLQDERYLIVNQGGIDAINQALFLNAVFILGPRVSHVTIPEDSGRAHPSDFPNKLLQERDKFLAKQMTSRFNYSAIVGLDAIHDEAKYFAGALHARLAFDFESAYHILGKCSAPVRRALQSTIDHVSKPENYVAELYRNAKIKLVNQQYVDFLLRLYRLLEETIRRKVSELDLPIKINVSNCDWRKQVEKLKEEEHYADLFSETSRMEFPINGKFQTIDITYSGVPSLLAIWSYYDRQESGMFWEALRLTELRNKSIGAHDFHPVSLHVIEDELEKIGVNFSVLVQQFDEYFLPDDSVHSFDQANKQLIALIERE